MLMPLAPLASILATPLRGVPGSPSRFKASWPEANSASPESVKLAVPTRSFVELKLYRCVNPAAHAERAIMNAAKPTIDQKTSMRVLAISSLPSLAKEVHRFAMRDELDSSPARLRI